MARRLDDMARDLRPGPLANDYQRLSSWGSAFPADAEAIVEPLPVAANQGGRRNRGWRVRFKARWAPTIDPLTGWTGGGDPLETIELRFPDRESAENYCAREGLAFRCVRHSSRLPNGPRLPADPAPMLCCWPSGPHALCCGAYPIAA
ncbi:MAG: hypothetical protein B7Z20_01150 [Sphingobium sp. 32-64-5]|jgi:hypothetical protein|nr:MAG: hypothetical protein B7Z20_01150 [Sphingobium sp. 32-64-5]